MLSLYLSNTTRAELDDVLNQTGLDNFVQKLEYHTAPITAAAIQYRSSNNDIHALFYGKHPFTKTRRTSASTGY